MIEVKSRGHVDFWIAAADFLFSRFGGVVRPSVCFSVVVLGDFMGDMVHVVGFDEVWWLVEAREGPAQLRMSACRDGKKGVVGMIAVPY